MDNAKRDTETEASLPQLARVLPELTESLQRFIEAQQRPSNDSTQSVSQRFQRGPLDLVGKALDEEFHGEQLKNIPKWAEVQILSFKTIDQENDACIAKYEGEIARVKYSCLSHIVLLCADTCVQSFGRGVKAPRRKLRLQTRRTSRHLNVFSIYIIV